MTEKSQKTTWPKKRDFFILMERVLDDVWTSLYSQFIVSWTYWPEQFCRENNLAAISSKTEINRLITSLNTKEENEGQNSNVIWHFCGIHTHPTLCSASWWTTRAITPAYTWYQHWDIIFVKLLYTKTHQSWDILFYKHLGSKVSGYQCALSFAYAQDVSINTYFK